MSLGLTQNPVAGKLHEGHLQLAPDEYPDVTALKTTQLGEPLAA